jgi:hypothetical protein
VRLRGPAVPHQAVRLRPWLGHQVQLATQLAHLDAGSSHAGKINHLIHLNHFNKTSEPSNIGNHLMNHLISGSSHAGNLNYLIH